MTRRNKEPSTSGTVTLVGKITKTTEGNLTKPKTVTGILEEIKQEICDDYCKYPTLAKREGELFEYNSPCMKCPLTRL